MTSDDQLLPNTGFSPSEGKLFTAYANDIILLKSTILQCSSSKAPTKFISILYTLHVRSICNIKGLCLRGRTRFLTVFFYQRIKIENYFHISYRIMSSWSLQLYVVLRNQVSVMLRLNY